MQGYPCKICGDFPVNSQLITCKSYILFNVISTCVPKVRNYGDFRQHAIPVTIMCMLRGTPCYTGIYYTFYRGNICSVVLVAMYVYAIANGRQSFLVQKVQGVFSNPSGDCIVF